MYSGGLSRGWYSGSEPPTDGPCEYQRKLLLFLSQDIIRNALLYQLYHLFSTVLRDSRTRLESQAAKTSLAPYLGSANKDGLGQTARIPGGLKGCFDPFTPSSLVEVQPRQPDPDEQRDPQPFLPDGVGFPKTNRNSFGVSVPQIPALMTQVLLAHVQFGSLGANTLDGKHFIPSRTPKMLSSRLE